MRRTAISSPAKRYQSMGPEEIAKVLRHWQSDVGFMAAVQDKAKRNPFPGIDMNKDWNRAACELHMHFSENWGEPDERMKIQQAFAGYSLWRQLEPIELELEELKGVFAKVFVGEGPGKESCSRIPGSKSRQDSFLSSRSGRL
jgi:hypothetical protein